MFDASEQIALITADISELRESLFGDNIADFLTSNTNNSAFSTSDFDSITERIQGLINSSGIDSEELSTTVFGRSIGEWLTILSESSDSLRGSTIDDIIGGDLVVNSEAINSLQLSDNDLVSQALPIVTEQLAEFVNDPDFNTKIQTAFGDGVNLSTAQDLIEDLVSGETSNNLKIVEVNNLLADGAFGTETNNIYLSQDFLEENADNPEVVATVLLEEFGHYIDSQLNLVDSPGDEGEIFAKLVRGDDFNDGELEALQAEDDTATLALDGFTETIEQASGVTYRTTFIPTTRPLVIQHTSGFLVSVQRGNFNFRPTVHLWYNNQYQGQYFIPVDLGDIEVGFTTSTRNTIGIDGNINTGNRTVPFLQIRGNQWRRIA